MQKSEKREEYYIKLKSRECTQWKNVKGYLTCTLNKNGKTRKITVHRLVALHFIPNPGFLEQVNHIDGDKTNNSVENLEWVTQSENLLHAVKTGLLLPHNSRPVVAERGDKSLFFKSSAEAGRKLGIDPGSISSVCAGHSKNRHTAGGYKWRYATRKEVDNHNLF